MNGFIFYEKWVQKKKKEKENYPNNTHHPPIIKPNLNMSHDPMTLLCGQFNKLYGQL
jgi:hypothetical protein